MKKRKILATAALPYANGDIHLGHLVEYLQADYWTRFQKMQGHECLYICADDTHGTPIMIRAREEEISPEELIARKHKEHEEDFKSFHIKFDNYYSTNSEENKILSAKIFKAMQEKGHVSEKTVEQNYCEHDKMFLPDRFVKGSCPKCKAKDQYGDSCDNCGTTYSPTELIEARCSLCANPPVRKESKHIFIKLNDFKEFLEKWVPEHNQPEIANKLKEWLDSDLRDWDISRDEPYFGFEIPGYKGKYFYVWMDAPVGYIASTWDWCKKNDRDLNEFWEPNDSSELYHFIGKDIVYFHSLFWPAMLDNAGFKTPDKVFVHGFLTVNGEKMSKSKGTFINAKTYLKHLNPSYLRYYYACKMSATVDDIDLNLQDMFSRVNSDLIGKITNLVSRGAQMLSKKLDGEIGELSDEGKILLQDARAKGELIKDFYEKREFSKAMIEIRSIADVANKYFDEKAPWLLIKEDPEKTKEILSAILNIFRVMAIYLKPVLPTYVEKVEALFAEEPYVWSSIETTLENHKLNSFSHILTRIDSKDIDKILEDSKS